MPIGCVVEHQPAAAADEEQNRLGLVLALHLLQTDPNALALAAAYGDDTDGWQSKPCVLYKARVEFRGKLVDAIRLRVPGNMQGSGSQNPEPWNIDPAECEKSPADLPY